jgi:catechol 2,3-dioxygenase-like lactoylglutathione lyase family enzyme
MKSSWLLVALQHRLRRDERLTSGAWRRGSNLGSLTIEHMTLQRMDHIGVVVDDLAATTEFFVELGLVLQGEASLEGRVVDRIVGLEGVRTEVAFMQTPDGHGRLELIKFHSPSNQGATRTPPRTRRVSATSHSSSKTSTPPLPPCAPAALNSSASWSATRTATGSATSAARRESSSS